MEQEGEEDNMDLPKYQTQMEVDPQKDKESEEEQIMRILLHEWRHLDERFIPEEQKQLYKDMFQKYKEKVGEIMANQPEQLGAQGTQSIRMGNAGKGGRKRGRWPMTENIQVVGEMLVNSGRVIPLSEVFQQLPKLLK